MQTILQRLGLEPVGVEGHHVGRLILFVVAREVLLEPLEHLLLVQVMQHALIQVRTVSALIALHVVSVQWDLPHAGEGARRARAALALVRDLVVEGVRPHWHGHWGNGDRAVVDVTKVFQNLERGSEEINNI